MLSSVQVYLIWIDFEVLMLCFTASIYEQSKTSPKELKLYEKLKALNQFHKRSGEEGVLHMRVKEKRNQVIDIFMDWIYLLTSNVNNLLYFVSVIFK